VGVDEAKILRYIEWQQAHKGREETIRFMQLLHYSVNEEIVTLSRGAELANKSLVDVRKEVKAVV
ncbi:MAG: hypothetical protein ACLFVG_07035, partial [Candidatus Aminicenantes bacterium]